MKIEYGPRGILSIEPLMYSANKTLKCHLGVSIYSDK